MEKKEETEKIEETEDIEKILNMRVQQILSRFKKEIKYNKPDENEIDEKYIIHKE